MQKSFGEASENKRAIYKWYKAFEMAENKLKMMMELEDLLISITGENVEEVLDNRLITIREVSEEVGSKICSQIVKFWPKNVS